MDRQILNITANEQILTCDNPIKISTNKVNYIEARFDLGENWSGYDSVRAVWFNDFYCISTVLDSNGVAFVPSEVMKRNGKVKVNLVGSISENDVLTDRLTSYPIVAAIVDCTAQINGAETAPVTPSQFEQYVAIVRSLVDSIKDIDHIELNSDYTLTIYYSDGTSDTTGSVRGADGNGIESVTKTSTSGLVDTYTITFTDGQTTTFNVTNGAKGDTGNGIASIEKTSTVGLVDTYTITYTDGTTSTFTVTNGEKGDKGDTGEVTQAELDEAVTDLKSDIGDISEVASEEEVTKSITATWTDGYVGTDGSVNESTSLHYTNKIAVKEGDVVSTSNQNFRFVTAYNNGVAVPSKGDALGNDNAYTVPADIDEIVITKYKSAGTDLTQKTTERVLSAKDTVARSDIKQLATMVDAEQEQYTKDITLPITWTSGYMDTSGGISASSSLVYSNHISVVEGDAVSCSSAFRFVTAFANGSAVSAKGDASGNNKTYTVPSGVDEVVVSIYTPEKDIIRSTAITEYIIERKPFGIFRASGDLNSGEAFSFADQNINKKIVTVFSGDIQSFSAIQVGRKTTSSDGYWVVIDATNITIYKDGTAGTPVAHGLTIENNIQVKIATDTDGKSNPRNFFKAVITVTSNGHSFSVTENYWTNKSNGNPFVLSSGSVLKNCSFSFQSLDMNKIIYAFGDSYFSWYPERWVFYLAQDGYADNILTNAFAGEPSSAAIKALRAIVPMGFPKYLLWCLGMNDGSDGSDAPNANWVSGRDAVINVCKEYGITPVFATIPTVPTINHEKKNEWIRSSGYRYVDFAKAVGAQSDGTWYSGMLDDGVHPTEAGAKALYNRLLADFPEVMIEN